VCDAFSRLFSWKRLANLRRENMHPNRRVFRLTLELFENCRISGFRADEIPALYQASPYRASLPTFFTVI
jgi:maltooligosyltrehalose synthase